jgi:hypothetical protein
MFKLSRLKFKVKWGLLLGLLVIVWLVNNAAHVVAKVVELPPWTQAVVYLIADVSFVALVILGLLTAGALALAVAKFVAKLIPGLFEIGVEEELEVMSEAEAVSDGLAMLSDRLDIIEENKSQAIMELRDADMLATELVGLIRRTVAKARDLAKEGEALEAALDAVAGGDPVAIARAAGALNDAHIRDLMLEQNGGEQYRVSVINLAATQTGALRSQSAALDDLSSRWIETLTWQRAQTARLGVVIDVLDAASPIARIEANLEAAQRLLMLEGKPETWVITRNLPAPAAARPMIEGYK